MAAHPIEQELCKVTKVKAKRKEDRQTFLGRLVEAVEELSEEDWEGLSTEAQVWVNDAVKAVKKDKEIPEPEGEDEGEDAGEDAGEEEEEATGEEEEGEEEEEKPRSRKGGKKGAKKAPAGKKTAKKAPKAPKAGKAGKAEGGQQVGVKVRIKKMLIKDPSMTVDDIAAQLEKDGDTPSRLTIGGIRADFRHSLKVLRDADLLEIEI